jgi:tRNA-splicing ligase RtcB
VIATKNTIMPSTVGVDIGCGMMACKLPWKEPDLDGVLPTIRSAIEHHIPVGHKEYDKRREREMPDWMFLAFTALPHQLQDKRTKASRQMGTLGGGNHFIEICLDENQQMWVMLHSGSRNIGKSIADVHIHEAKGLMKKYLIDLPDPDLAFLVEGTPEFQAYWNDLQWAQAYALENRKVMMDTVLNILIGIYGCRPSGKLVEFEVNCHHNYVEKEHHFGHNVFVTRKGAVRARENDYGIIPGSMGAKSYIVKGKGNEDSFCSCSHGAGRKMSRTKARNTFTEEDLANQTAGIECRKDKGVVDEIPGAYKDIDEVMRNQAELVEVVATLKQVICVKG